MFDIDTEIVKNYIQQITDPIKFGENGVFFWFPGTGMTTVIRDLFSNKKLLKQALGKLYFQIEVIQFTGHLTSNKNFKSVLNESGFKDYEALKKHCTSLLNKGSEIVIVLSRIDDFQSKEKLSILKSFLRLHSINPRRVHILFHTINKPWFTDAIQKNPELVAIANKMVIMPILKDKLLDQYIKTRAKQYQFDLTEVDVIRISKLYGGILQLTKEYIRSKGDYSVLELKLKMLWNAIPKSYREILEQNMTHDIPMNKAVDFIDLEKFGILDLNAFNIHKSVLNINSEKIILSLLTSGEKELYKYFNEHKGALVDKDKVIELLRPDKKMDVSLWSIDKAISRFRVKMQKSSIDPSVFKTIKGKGYIWESN